VAVTDLTIIRRSLASRSLATVVTTVMVAVSVALMLLLLGLRDAGARAFERGSGTMHMMVSRDASPLVAVLNGVFYANPPRRPIAWSEYEALQVRVPKLAWAIPIQQGDSYRGFPVLATTEDFFVDFQPAYDEPWRVDEGRLFEDSFEVVLGATVARQTGLAIGETIHLTHGIATGRGAGGEAMEPHVHREFDYRVVGILEPTGGPHDRALFTDLPSSWILHAHDRRRAEDSSITTTTEDDHLEIDRPITGSYLRVASRAGARVSPAQQEVFNRLRADPSLTVADPVQEVRNLFRIIGQVDDLLLAMAAIVMVSGAIGILLALASSMAQRRRQIAVLRVLGCSRGRICWRSARPGGRRRNRAI